DRRIEEVVVGAAAAYLDGTFFDAAELPGRDMREIPHPFIEESLARLASLPTTERAHVRFIHLNHTNLAAIRGTAERRRARERGLGVERSGERGLLGARAGCGRRPLTERTGARLTRLCERRLLLIRAGSARRVEPPFPNGARVGVLGEPVIAET